MRNAPDANGLTISHNHFFCSVMSQRETGWKCINIHPQVPWKLKPAFFA